MEPYYEADGRLPSLPRVDQVMTGLTAAEVATVREVRSHIVTGHKLTPLLVEDLLAIVDRLTGTTLPDHPAHGTMGANLKRPRTVATAGGMTGSPVGGPDESR